VVYTYMAQIFRTSKIPATAAEPKPVTA